MSKALHFSRLSNAEHARAVHRVMLAPEHTIEDLKEPSFWAHVSNKMRVHDLIEVIPENGAWFATLIVRDVGRLAVGVAILSVKQLGEIEKRQDDSLYVLEHTRALDWTVKRKADNQRVSDGHKTKEAAERWARENVKAA